MIITSELLRDLLDLPDAIAIIDVRPVARHGHCDVVLDVHHGDERAASQIRPVWEQYVEGDIVRIRIVDIDGYGGALVPRPSTKRRQANLPLEKVALLQVGITDAHARGDHDELERKLAELAALAENAVLTNAQLSRGRTEQPDRPPLDRLDRGSLEDLSENA